MPRLLAATFAGIILTAICSAAPLPPTAIEDNTVLLMHVDLARIDPTSVRGVVRDVLTGVAPQYVAGADTALAVFQVGYESLTSAGLQSVNLVLTTRKDDQPPDWAAYIQVRPGSDETALRKMLTADKKDEEIPKFAHVGGFLVEYGHDQELPSHGSPTRAKVFAEAMSDAGRDATVTLALVPNDQIRALAGAVPTAGLSPAAADIIPFLLKSRWVLVVASLGRNPGVGVTIRAEDEPGAQYLAEKLKALSGGYSNEASDAHGGDSGQAARNTRPPVKPNDPANAVAAVIHPIRQGAKVSFSVQGAAFRQLAAALVPSAANARQRATASDSAEHMRALCAAFTRYVAAHNGMLPENIQQLRPFVEKDQSFDDLLKNPRTGGNPGFIYAKPAARISAVKDPVHTPILFESKNGIKDPGGSVGYATGQVEEAKGS